MAGCCVVFLAFIVIPFICIALLAFLGFVVASIIAAIVSTVALVLLTKYGIFKKYEASVIDWQRIVALIVHSLLIVIMIGSYISSIVTIFLLLNMR